MTQSMEPLVDGRTAPAPVPGIRTIVIGADGSAGAELALEWAAQVGEPMGATVIAVHVVTANRALAKDFSFETIHTWRRELEAQLRGPWVEPLRRRHVPYRCVMTEHDTAASGLVHAARQAHADLIVVGSRGRSSLTLTSTSHVLNHRAECPVVVVPPRWQPAPAP